MGSTHALKRTPLLKKMYTVTVTVWPINDLCHLLCLFRPYACQFNTAS